MTELKIGQPAVGLELYKKKGDQQTVGTHPQKKEKVKESITGCRGGNRVHAAMQQLCCIALSLRRRRVP
ncbi:hypothetical protein V5799_026674 [Amblyomma americanum]|uniref:Uncharacterized protein n=1 Tax=Amblyomma americanum TaxID=6943 RepID=A0AAQ4DHW8_AMBAM